MTAATIVALLAAVVLAATALLMRRRAARERRSQGLLRQGLAEIVERSDLALRVEPADRRHLALHPESGAAALVLPYERCRRATPEALLEGARYLLDRDASGHEEALVLRRQGTDIAPLLVRRAWLDAFPGEEGVPSTPLGESGLAAVYRLLSHPGLLYLTEACLVATGVKIEDLHDAVLAMLRQRFDESAVQRVIERGETLVLDDEEDRSAAYLFLVPELLGPDQELLAAVPRAGCLGLARHDSAEALEAMLRRSSSPMPLAPKPLVVRHGGVHSL